ncbi:MAG: methyltransferase domain-containing protein [Bdellovibrionales bacterium]|nr:methyltransferase domain-containing protein [Bdellovibrionales bacterium]
MSEDRDYLHGYTHEEQQRLIDQAEILAPQLYEGLDFSNHKKMLEVGCGVGAQTGLLAERFPELHIHGVDVSQAQVALAKDRLPGLIKQGRVQFTCADATDLTAMEDDGFDSAYICWFLEHVYEPIAVLKSLKAKLKPGSKVYLTEVNNSSLFVQPYSPNILQYWSQFNDYQWTINGHPFIGLMLPNLLLKAGFKNVVSEPRSFFFDDRDPAEREKFMNYFFGIFNSANDILVRKGRIHHEMIKEVQNEFERAMTSEGSVFYYSYVRATAEA